MSTEEGRWLEGLDERTERERRDEATAPTDTEETTARIAEVLAEHVEPRAKVHPDEPWKYDSTYLCSCGDEFMAEHGPGGLAIAHRAHVAAVLSAGVIRDMQAAAWDEGYDARGVDIANEGLTYTTLTPNPYRAARIEEGA